MTARSLLLLDRCSGGSGCRRGCLIGRRGSFVGASTGQNAFERVVALVTGIFEDPAFGCAELIFAAPRGIPYGGILNLELIEDAMRSYARESLGDFQFLPSAA